MYGGHGGKGCVQVYALVQEMGFLLSKCTQKISSLIGDLDVDQDSWSY